MNPVPATEARAVGPRSGKTELALDAPRFIDIRLAPLSAIIGRDALAAELDRRTGQGFQ